MNIEYIRSEPLSEDPWNTHRANSRSTQYPFRRSEM